MIDETTPNESDLKPRTWKIGMSKKIRVAVEVQANSREEAQLVARTRIENMDLHEATADALWDQEICYQIAGPWISVYWRDFYKRSNIVVAYTPSNHSARLTARDVIELRRRLESLGLRSTDEWDGAGCTTVSFRCDGWPDDDSSDFSAEERAMLEAPRSYTETQKGQQS